VASGSNRGPRIGLFSAGVAALVIACAGEITDPEGYEPVGSAGSATNAGSGGGNAMAGGSGMGGGGSMMAGRGGSGSPSGGGSAVCMNGGAILNRACDGGSCHGDPSNQSTITSDGAALVGVPTSFNSMCDKVLIDPVDTSQSLVLLKVQGMQPEGCGGRMPPGLQDPLLQIEIDCVASWLTQFQQ
jgi:hypothetical protein